MSIHRINDGTKLPLRQSGMLLPKPGVCLVCSGIQHVGKQTQKMDLLIRFGDYTVKDRIVKSADPAAEYFVGINAFDTLKTVESDGVFLSGGEHQIHKSGISLKLNGDQISCLGIDRDTVFR